MPRKLPTVFIILTLLVLLSGCLAENEPVSGSPGMYQLEWIGNSTSTYYINITTIQAVITVENVTSFKIDRTDQLSTESNLGISNIYVQTINGTNVTPIISKKIEPIRKYIDLNFNRSFTGFIAYSEKSTGSVFKVPLDRKGIVRIILPENYTTGNPALGMPKPTPDNRTVDRFDREVLIWNDPYPRFPSIEVTYYQTESPLALELFVISILIVAIFAGLYYYYGIEKLKRRRMLIERDVRGKK